MHHEISRLSLHFEYTDRQWVVLPAYMHCRCLDPVAPAVTHLLEPLTSELVLVERDAEARS